MKRIAYIPLLPLGDVICCINQIDGLKQLYAPCEITVFAIPLIAELLGNYRLVDHVVIVDGKVNGDADLSSFMPPKTRFDAVFNIGYHVWTAKLASMLDAEKRYGSESYYLTRDLCKKYFDAWVSQEYWTNITLKRYRTVCEQMAEPIRLANPDFNFVFPDVDPTDYRTERPPFPLPENFVLFLLGTSSVLKIWPLGKWLALAETLEQAGFSIVLSIGPQDHTLKKRLNRASKKFTVLDSVPLAQLAFAALRAKLVVGHDSGPMHFAAMLRCPTVHLIAGASAFNWYPYEEPQHSLVMPRCASESACSSCAKTCIGKIVFRDVLTTVFRRLNLPVPKLKKIAYFGEDFLGDSIVGINALEALARIYAPCEITVLTPPKSFGLFRDYAYADNVVAFDSEIPENFSPPNVEFDAVFNPRYDATSVKTMGQLKYRKAYGYETSEIPESVCRKVYTRYVPLTMWDDDRLRFHTSVSEQVGTLVRLVDPEFHCPYPFLGENSFCRDFSVVEKYELPRGSVLLVPGGSCDEKHWGDENFFALAEALKSAGVLPFFLIGPRERRLTDELKKRKFRFALCPGIAEIVGLATQWMLEQAFAIGNDTGIMHLLKALDCRSITLGAGSSFLTWHPYEASRHAHLHAPCASRENCQDCRKFCVEFRKISPAHVFEIFSAMHKA